VVVVVVVVAAAAAAVVAVVVAVSNFWLSCWLVIDDNSVPGLLWATMPKFQHMLPPCSGSSMKLDAACTPETTSIIARNYSM
jgi:hypothetical protein